MRLLDLSLPHPAENLACDEALLDDCEENGGAPILRLWEPPSPFVVVGFGETVAREVDQEACAAERIPILRRCSGGGTVLQAPGCLNYSLILEIKSDPDLGSVTGTNRFVMNRQRDALQKVLGHDVEVRGCTDLTWRGRKFSGNSQRRKRRYLLFHGTFLLTFDVSLMQRLLRFPSRSPDYRDGRSHTDFVACLNRPKAEVAEVVSAAWNANTSTLEYPRQRLEHLVATKYSLDSWNLRVKESLQTG